jgi:DNA-binding SARP family transcriptional activator
LSQPGLHWVLPLNESLRISLFGGLSIQHLGEPVSNLSTRKAKALLVYLVCNQQEQARDVLATLFWEDQPQVKALTNLRAALTSLRKCLDAYLLTSRNTLGILPEADIWLDVHEFEKCLQHGETDTAVSLYRGEFLRGFSLRDSSFFEEWVR